MFEPWQGPALTTILHRQKLGYMRTHLDDILAPRQAESILATYSRGRVFTIPLDWFACPTTLYSSSRKNKEKTSLSKATRERSALCGNRTHAIRMEV